MSKIELLHVYVLKDEHDTVKIGIAGNVAKCIKAIDHATAYQITNRYESPSCVNARKIEKAAHRHFADRRKKGEWFNVPFDEAVDFVKGHFVDQPIELNREFNGIKIRQRASDNYLDATAMCQANGKLFADYQRLKTTQEFLEALSLNMGIPIIKLIQVESGRYGGSWVHPRVSINLAQWCSPEFAVLVTDWVFELMTKGHVSLNAQSALAPELTTYIDARIHEGITNALAKPITPQREVHGSRIQVRQAIAEGAETLKEMTEIVDISYDALRKLVQRMVADGEIERSKVGRTFKHFLTEKLDVSDDYVQPEDEEPWP